MAQQNIKEDQISQIILFLQYCNLHFYTDQPYPVLFASSILFLILIGFILVFLLSLCQLKSSQPKTKIVKKWYGQVFIHAFDFFALLGFYPMMIIFLSIFPFIQGIEETQGNENIFIVLAILSTPSILIIVLFSIFYSIIYYNEWVKKRDALTRKQCYSITILICIRYLNVIFITFSQIEWSQRFIVYFNLISSVILIMIMIHNLNFQHYQQVQIRFLFTQSILIYFCFSFAFYLHIQHQIKPVFAIIVIYGLVWTIFKTSLRALQIRAFFQESKDARRLELKVQVFTEFQKNNQIVNNVGDLIYFGHIYHHLANKCRNQYTEFGMRCFCTMKIAFDSKLQKDIRKTIQAIRNHRSSFTKFMIKSLYETLIQTQPRNIELRFLYAQFLYFKMKNKIQAFEQIQWIWSKKANLHMRLRLALMASIADENANDLNSLAYHNFLDFEYVVEMEETISQIYQVIMKLLSLYCSFWRRLTKNPQVEQVQIDINKDIDKEMTNCNNLWKNLMKHEVRVKQQDVIISFLSKRLKWKFVYFWYRLFILNKKVRLTQIESLSSATLHQEIVNEDSDSDYEIKVYEQFNNSKPFNHMSLIIHSLLNGQIIKCSQSCKEVLEFENLKYISQLIPEVLQRNHQNAIKLLLYCGKSKTLHKSRKIFIKHSKGYVIQARKYLKWQLDQQNQINFVAMIRPIIRLEQINFIILNGDWEVDAVTRPLFNILQQKTCLLLLCTGLFQFSKFGYYLDQDDITRFKLTQHSKSLNMTQSRYYNSNESINNNYVTNSQKTNNNDKNTLENDDQSFTFFGEDNIEYYNSENPYTNKRLFKIVDEQHVKLTLRLPKKLSQLNEEYEYLKAATLQDAIQHSDLQTLYNKKNRLIYRNAEDKLRINKLVLFRRLFDFNQIQLKQMFDNLRDLFEKYCSQNRLLDKIIKLDATIHFTKTISMDKYTIIKINKYEIFEYHQRQFRETMNILSESRIKQSRPSLIEMYMDPRIFGVHQQVNNSEVDSNRIDQNKSFLTEGQVFPEFVQYHPTEVVLKLENNIFFKQDNNKVAKKIKEITFFIFFNRIMIITLYLLAAIGFFKGPSLTQHVQIYSEIQQLQLISKLSLCMIQTYEYALDLYLFDKQNMTDIETLQYLQKSQEILQQSTQFINQSLSAKKFVEIFLGYQMLENPINDLIAQYMTILNEWNKSEWKFINPQFNMLDELRAIIIPKVQTGLLISYSQQYNNQMNRLLEYQQFAIFEIVITICLTFFFVIANEFQIIKVINKNKVILYLNQTIIKSLHLLSKAQITTSIQYVAWLKLQLKFLIDLETMKFLNSKTTQTSYCEQMTKYDNKELSVQINNKANSYIESDQWFKIKIVFLLYYLIFIIIITSFVFYYLLFLQSFQNGALSIFNENQFVKYQKHLYAMVSIKELYIYDYIDNSNTAIEDIKKNVQKFINQIQDESDQIYETNIDQVFQMLYGNYCELLLEIMPNTGVDDYDSCQHKLSGAFTRGLNQYHLLLSQIAISLLNPHDTRYDQPTLSALFEFSEVQKNAYQIEQLILNLWCEQYFLYADNEMFLDILSMYSISQQQQMFNVFFYIYLLCILY
ncbi:unnamed protein product [Paramecium octaurelia]|uniref:Transmembrane protein n=1 Tax=Paramecium octaurelia TaxID=43137 RepID=A0A8S1V2A9_PAROT|nr:unnamed protein product [Paramecium octaurelia]